MRIKNVMMIILQR